MIEKPIKVDEQTDRLITDLAYFLRCSKKTVVREAVTEFAEARRAGAAQRRAATRPRPRTGRPRCRAPERTDSRVRKAPCDERPPVHSGDGDRGHRRGAPPGRDRPRGWELRHPGARRGRSDAARRSRAHRLVHRPRVVQSGGARAGACRVAASLTNPSRPSRPWCFAGLVRQENGGIAGIRIRGTFDPQAPQRSITE